MCLTETSESSVDSKDLLINGYNLLRTDHPDNIKRVGVYLCYKENLNLRLIDTHYIDQ